MEAVSTVCTGSLETILHKKLPTRGLLISKQLFTDSCNITSTENSTGNAPNSINNAQYILTDEVYTNLEKCNAKNAIGIKANTDAQKYLTPVTIMVVGKIFSVKSRISSEVEPKTIFMGHEISSFHAPVVSSFIVLFKNLVSS